MKTPTNEFLTYVNGEVEEKIFDLASDGKGNEIENIKISFYGKTLEIVTTADRYEEFLNFLVKLDKMEKEDESLHRDFPNILYNSRV